MDAPNALQGLKMCSTDSFGQQKQMSTIKSTVSAFIVQEKEDYSFRFHVFKLLDSSIQFLNITVDICIDTLLF